MTNLRETAPLGYSLVQVARTHRRWVSAALEQLGLHVGQELLLARLCGREGDRQTVLAEALGVELPTVHKMLARLEKAGFVERRADPGDARASLAYLTPEGRETCARIQEIWREADRRLRQALPTDVDAADLERLLTALADRLEHP